MYISYFCIWLIYRAYFITYLTLFENDSWMWYVYMIRCIIHGMPWWTIGYWDGRACLVLDCIVATSCAVYPIVDHRLVFGGEYLPACIVYILPNVSIDRLGLITISHYKMRITTQWTKAIHVRRLYWQKRLANKLFLYIILLICWMQILPYQIFLHAMT